MRRTVVLSMLISFAMMCACKKQDVTADAQLAQRKAELDAREKALDERENALGDREKAITKTWSIPSDLEARKPTVDPEQVKAEREKRIQQLPPELQSFIRDRSLLNPRTEKPTATQDRSAELQRRLEEARSRKMNAMTPSNTEAADTRSTSPVPSPTPE